MLVFVLLQVAFPMRVVVLMYDIVRIACTVHMPVLSLMHVIVLINVIVPMARSCSDACACSDGMFLFCDAYASVDALCWRRWPVIVTMLVIVLMQFVVMMHVMVPTHALVMMQFFVLMVC